MESARVSSPQVDLTRCGLDKTPTLLILQSRVNPPPARRRNPPWTRTPPQRGGTAQAEIGNHFLSSTREKEGDRPKVVLPSTTTPSWGGPSTRGPHGVSFQQRKNTGGSNPHAVTRCPKHLAPPMRRLLGLPLPPIEKSGVGCRVEEKAADPWAPREGARTSHARCRPSRAQSTRLGGGRTPGLSVS